MELAAPTVEARGSGNSKRLRYADIADFFAQLSSLVEAGVTQKEALALMCEGWDTRRMNRFVTRLHARVEAGHSLSAALSAIPHIIPPFLSEIVAEGERNNELAQALGSVADYLQSVSLVMPNQPSILKHVFYYPFIVLAVVGLLTAILLIFVVPQFAELFSGFGAELPALTQFLVDLSYTANAWAPLLLLVALVFVVLWFWGVPRSALIQQAAIRLLCTLPGYRHVYRKGHSALLLTTWGFLLSRGMSLPEAVSTSSQLALGPYWRECLRLLAQAMGGEGRGQLQGVLDGLVTPRVGQYLRLSKRLTRMESILAQQGLRYQQQVERAYHDITHTLEPLLILIVGLIVGTFVIGMYLPIFKMGSVV